MISGKNIGKYTATFLVLGLLLYLTLRSDSSFRSIPWMPKGFVMFVQKNLNWRNFWGFLPAGLFFGFVYYRWMIPLTRACLRRVAWVLLIPIVKELLQIPLPTRHCNTVGMMTGILGLLLGGVTGCCARYVMHAINARIKKSKMQPSQSDPATDGDGRVDVGG